MLEQKKLQYFSSQESDKEKIARLEQMLKTQNSELENFKKTVNDLRASGPSGSGGSGNSIIVRQDTMVKYPIPRLEENMTWDEYKASVETWKDMCEIEPSKQGPLLISGLPVKGDQVGGIQRLVYNNVKATLKTATGADDIVKEIKRIMLKPSRLISRAFGHIENVRATDKTAQAVVRPME